MVGDQWEQRAQGVFAVVQPSWEGLHSAVLLGHRQQPEEINFHQDVIRTQV